MLILNTFKNWLDKVEKPFDKMLAVLKLIPEQDITFAAYMDHV